MDPHEHLKEIQSRWHGSRKAYYSGFLLSIVLTIFSFLIITQKWLPKLSASWTIVGLAIIQCFVQLILFLHLGKETKPKWNLIMFFLMFTILVIVVVGTFWIMFDLNNRVMGM